MSGVRLQLPTIQNWSCHNCGGCCRQHLIEVTPEEKARIEGQGWTAAEGVPADQPIFVPHGGLPWRKQYRLNHRSDGGCVFLDEHGLCRIHAKFGEAAKPLACRIYPYAFHPSAKGATVSLRFSCPSVVSNRGRRVTQQKADLDAMARLVVPESSQPIPPPEIRPGERLDWPDTLRIVNALDNSLADGASPLVVRVLRTLSWMELIGQAKFDQIRGDRLDELLGLVRDAANGEIAEAPDPPVAPSAAGRLQFRMLVAQYARRDTSMELKQGWRYRWRLFRAAMRFARGQGMIPPLQVAFRETPFDVVERPFGLPDGWDELFTRYLRVKLQGLHFCGPAYYDIPVVEGFQSLVLVVPVVLWLARWLAAGDGRSRLNLDDVERSLAIADHHHGYAPALGTASARRRTRLLAQAGDVPRLVAWYAR